MAITRQVGRRVVVLQNTEAEVSTSQTIAPQYTWGINGELTIPTETALDVLHQIDAAAQLHEVRVSARVAGDSQYRIKIINRDLLGTNPNVLVDQTLTFASDRRIYSLVINDASLEQNSSLEVTVHEVGVGTTPARDLTISAIVENFGESSPIRNGHIIQRDDNTSLPQQEILKFAGAFQTTDNIIDGKTEVTLTTQAVINLVYPVGGYITADLTEAQIQSQMGAGFVLADGRSVVGSAYETLTGNSTIPDARGVAFRAKNEGRIDGNENPDGELPLGTFQDEEILDHKHLVSGADNGVFDVAGGGGLQGSSTPLSGNPALPNTLTAFGNGGNETRMKNITVNRFIRIN